MFTDSKTNHELKYSLKTKIYPKFQKCSRFKILFMSSKKCWQFFRNIFMISENVRDFKKWPRICEKYREYRKCSRFQKNVHEFP